MMVGRAIASAVALFDVSTVLYSGVVVDTFGDAMVEPMRRELVARARLPGLTDLRMIQMSDTGAALIGAAALARTGSPG